MRDFANEYRAALEAERDAYKRAGLPQRVADVEAALEAAVPGDGLERAVSQSPKRPGRKPQVKPTPDEPEVKPEAEPEPVEA